MPITVGIIYQPPNQSNFLQTLNENFGKLDTLKKELYILGDFNINLYQNQNLCKMQNHYSKKTVSNDVKNHLQFCTMFGLTQIIKPPARITYSSTSFIGHILASLSERISQEGVINVFLSDHQLIYCTRKISRIKTGGVHKKIKFYSLKNYAFDAYKNTLRKINFPNHKYFEDVKRAYSDFFIKLMTL